MSTIDVYFDVTCRFAHRLHRWLADLDVDARWHPFSLLEANREDDGPPVWEGDEHADNISVLMLAGHELVRDRGGDTSAYRSALFHAWHDTDQRLDADAVLDHARRAGVEGDREDLQAALELVGQQQRDATRRGVFGSSTIMFASGQGAFVQFTDVPGVDDGSDILAALSTLADQAPELRLFERVGS